MTTERAPKGLGAEGRRVWRAVIADAKSQGLILDSREAFWLENAARLADRIGELEAELSRSPSFVVAGHAKQDVAHPLIGEVRMHRALLATTLARIRVDLPAESGSSSGSVLSAAVHGRRGADVKWRGGA